MQLGEQEIDIIPYPFDNATVTLGIEDDIRGNPQLGNVQQGYLHNVVARETPPDQIHQTAVIAQAIAARTYAYWQIDDAARRNISLNNSAQFQVYVPFSHHAADKTAYPTTPDERELLNQAVANRYYLSYHEAYDISLYGENRHYEADMPIFAEFKQDSTAYTVNHPQGHPYMLGVPDPISTHPELNPDFHEAGLIQRGASRWALSNRIANPYDPAGKRTSDDVWSVQWSNPWQILNHYYSGIQIRDADNSNQIITPDYRWVPLSLSAPTRGCINQSAPFEITFQNTGVQHWDYDGDVRFDAHVTYLGGGGPAANASAAPALAQIPALESSDIGLGATVQLPFTITFTDRGRYRIVFDMTYQGHSFTTLAADAGKEWFNLVRTIALYDCSQPQGATFAPLVMSTDLATESSH